MTANTPSPPHNEGDTFTNDDTGIKYQYINGAWRAVSSKAAQDVSDALGQLDLQKVTENGNSTNQGIEIKNSRLKTYGEVYFQSNGDTPVTLDSGSSYKPMLHLKSYSSTTTTEEGEPDAFARKDVLKISARGEAELFGHLKAEPGENSNQVIVYDQYKELQDSIVSLQQEIEKLSLVLDEGGDYRLLSTPENPADYVRDGIVYFGNTAGNPITDPSSWDEVGSIFIDTVDRNGDTHDFGPDVVQPGDLIELVGDSSFALFEVKGTGQYEEGLNKRFAAWATTTIKATGVPGPQATEYKIKSFRLGSLDVAETDARYVNLTGDEMAGPLQIKPETAAVALDLHPGPGQASGTSILRVYGDGGKTNLYVSGSGSLGARQGWSPNLGNHLTTKDYVDLLDAQTRDYVDTKFNSEMPVGSIVFWGGTRAKIPSGWQECDGSVVSAATKALTGMNNTPNLQDYFPAGTGGRLATTVGNQYGSRLKKHSHTVSRLEPNDTTGDPDDSAGTSSSRYRYWRGNADNNGTQGSTKSKTSSIAGESDFNAPPVYGGIYIMKVA